jgi:hypothetical protein
MAPGHRRWISGRPRAGPSDADRLPDTRTPARSTAAMHAGGRPWRGLGNSGFRIPSSPVYRFDTARGKSGPYGEGPCNAPYRPFNRTTPLAARHSVPSSRCDLSHMAAVMSGVQRSGRWKLIRTLAYREVTIRTYARGGSGPTRPWPRAGSVRAPARLRPPCPRGTREPRCAPSQAHASWRMSFVIRAISDPQVHRLARSHRPFSEPRSG